MEYRIQLEVGDVNDIEAHVTARVVPASAGQDLEEGVVLSGVLRGPYCTKARTLPAEIAFRSETSNATVARVVVPDPCEWTAELPHVYEVELQATQHGRLMAQIQERVGFQKGSK